MKSMISRTAIKLLAFMNVMFIAGGACAASPILTFTPLTPTKFELSAVDTALVKYVVQNQSSKLHRLVMKPIPGIHQITTPGSCPSSFILDGKQTCTLTLEANGSLLKGSIQGGPAVCQQQSDGSPNALFCYQPSAANVLNITLTPIPQYTVIGRSGAHGSISPSGAQQINKGSDVLFTASPNVDYIPYQWEVDGAVAQTGGSTFLLSNITANHTVIVTFTNKHLFYTGTQAGRVFYSFNDGLTWDATSAMPAGGSPINSVFASSNALYAGASNGVVYYSTNNGAHWTSTSALDGSAVNSVFATTNILYASTAAGLVYYSTDNGAHWYATRTPDGSSVNSVYAIDNTLYAGTANGWVYYSENHGATWVSINSQPDGSAIKQIFVNKGSLYVNTGNEFAYSSSHLKGQGSWTAFAQTVYSLFVSPRDNTVYAGTQGGYVYSVTASTALGFVDYTLINSVFVLN